MTPAPADALTPLEGQARSLSFNQDLIVLICESQSHGSDGDLSSQNAVRCVELEGVLDLDALRAAMHVLHRRHEMLRTRFLRVGDSWAQCVTEPTEVMLDHIDLVALHPEPVERRAALVDLVEAEHFRRFELDWPPLWSVRAFTFEPGRHLLMIRACHLIADLRSTQILHRELDTEYRRAMGEPLAPLTPAVQYEEHARAQREGLERFLQGGRSVKEWREVVAFRKVALFGLRQAGRLVGMHLAPGATRSGTMAALEHPLDGEGLRAIRQVARQRGVTAGVVCLAAWHVALQRWSHLDRLVVWSEKSTRDRAFSEVVGTFADATVFITDVEGRSFTELVADLDHQQSMFLRSNGLIVAGVKADPDGLGSMTELLASSQRVFFQFFGQELPWPDDAVLRPSSLGEPYEFQDSALDLHCYLIATRSSLRVRLRWDTGVFERAPMAALLQGYVDVLSGLRSTELDQ